MPDPNGSPDFVARIIAGIGLVLAIGNFYFNFQNRRLALRQEARRSPRLSVSVERSTYSHSGSLRGRVYTCCINIRNATDTPNSVSEVDFGIRYNKGDEISIFARLGVLKEVPEDVCDENIPAIDIPLLIPPRGAISGRLMFFAADKLLEGARIEGYELILGDTQGKLMRLPIKLINGL